MSHQSADFDEFGIKFSDISNETTEILRNFMEQTSSEEPVTSSVVPFTK